EKGKEILGKI
nr:RecName: Full=Toxin To56; AltName: Full=Toxin Tc56 [Tityus obscurus]